MRPGGKVPECLNNIIVVMEQLNDEIYGWMLKTTEHLKIHLPTKTNIFVQNYFVECFNFPFSLLNDKGFLGFFSKSIDS